MAELKFKVGDWVIAKPNNGYGITTNGWIGEVIYANEGWFSAEGREKFPKNEYEDLDYDSFDLYKAKEPVEPTASTSSFYDPSYFEDGHTKKEIKSVEDALTILASHGMCSGAECKECAVRMYCHGGECDNTMKNATSFLHRNAPEYDILGCLLYGEGDDEYYSDNANDVNSVYEIIKKLLKSPAPENTKSDCKTCKGCSQLTNIGGVPFCKAWHNWTVEDGYCYLYSDRIEDVESVENCVDKSV